jgi:hypothetical protein
MPAVVTVPLTFGLSGGRTTARSYRLFSLTVSGNIPAYVTKVRSTATINKTPDMW